MQITHLSSLLLLVCLLLWAGRSVAQDSTFAPITNFEANPGVRLVWSAPGDDGLRGTAQAYDIRYSTDIITPTTWSQAQQIKDQPVPLPAGTIQSLFVDNLEPGRTYFFAMKAVDDAGNWSPLSGNYAAEAEGFICGDINADGRVNVSDELYLINFAFRFGPPPQPMAAADTNGDGFVDMGDIRYLVAYVHLMGAPPICPE